MHLGLKVYVGFRVLGNGKEHFLFKSQGLGPGKKAPSPENLNYSTSKLGISVVRVGGCLGVVG